MNDKEKNIKNKIKEIKLRINKNLFFLLFLLCGVFILNNYWSDLVFFMRSNYIIFVLTFPFIFLFIWFYKKNIFSTHESFWTVISVLTAVLFFLFQNASQDAVKGFTIYAAHQYNCSVADSIISLDQHQNKNEKFTLQFFVTEPYFENIDLLFGNYSTTTGYYLIYEIYEMQSANTLIDTVIKLNVDGVNPSNIVSNGYFIDMYNKQLISIAKNIKNILPCNFILEKEKNTFLNKIKQLFIKIYDHLKIKFNIQSGEVLKPLVDEFRKTLGIDLS